MKDTFPTRDAKAQAEFDERRERRREAESESGTILLMWVAFFIFVIYSNVAEAETGQAIAELSWKHPTQRTNGEPLPIDALGGYELEIQGPQRDKVVELGVTTEYADTAEYSYGNVAVSYRLRAVDTFGLKGAWSEPAEYTTTVKPGAAPAAPALNVRDGSAGSSAQ